MEGKEPSRHIKLLEWEQSKLHGIKAILDATHKARMSKRQHRTSPKITRVQEICLAHPYPALLARLTQSWCCHVIDNGQTIREVSFFFLGGGVGGWEMQKRFAHKRIFKIKIDLESRSSELEEFKFVLWFSAIATTCSIFC